MAVTLLGYLENLILYQFGAYACFDLKTRMPWIQIAGAGMCALLTAVSELLMPVNVSDVSLSITSYGVMLCVVFLALKEEWRRRFSTRLLSCNYFWECLSCCAFWCFAVVFLRK